MTALGGPHQPDDRTPLRRPDELSAAQPAGSASTPDDGGWPAETDKIPPSVETTAVKADFAQFYRWALPKLVAFLRWQGASLADATDHAQETLTRCYQYWAMIDSDKRYPWCRRTAGNIFIRHFATIEELVDDIERHVVPPLRGDANLDAVDHRHTMLRVIDRLPIRQRQVLAWTYDGAPDVEIAQALDISEAGVRASRRKARRALAHLGKAGGEVR